MFKDILLPVDLEETELTARAIVVAQGLAQQHQASITVMTVIPDFNMPVVANFFPDDALEKARREVERELQKLIKARFREPSLIKTHVLQGSPHRIIVDYALDHGTDLIIMPSRGRDVSKVFLGSSTTHVVQRAPCSVLVVRPEKPNA
jgi:nucleotide-binding universal stress UspA family protein